MTTRMPMSPRLRWRSSAFEDLARDVERRIEAEGEGMKAVAHGAVLAVSDRDRTAVLRQITTQYLERTEPLRRQLVEVYTLGCELVVEVDALEPEILARLGRSAERPDIVPTPAPPQTRNP